MSRKTIGIDVDGVLADSMSRWLQEAERRYGIKALKADITEYELSDVFPILTHQQILDDWKHIWGNYHEIRLEDRDIPSITDNLHGKFDIYVTTANPSPNIQKWLKMNNIVYDKIIQLPSHTDKHKLDSVGLYVDDFPEVIDSAIKTGKAAIIFRQPYNDEFIKNNSGVPVAYNWRDLEDILMTQF